jgi:hypothetical protein
VGFLFFSFFPLVFFSLSCFFPQLSVPSTKSVTCGDRELDSPATQTNPLCDFWIGRSAKDFASSKNNSNKTERGWRC